MRLTVGLLETCACTTASELLGLWATWVGNKERAVIGHEDLLDLTLGCLVDIFLEPRHKCLRNCLANGIDLCCVTTTLDADADVHLLVSVGSEEEHRFPHLELQGLRLDKLNGYTIDFDEAL